MRNGVGYAGPPFHHPTDVSISNTGEIYVLIGSTGLFYDYLSNAVQEFACECAP